MIVFADADPAVLTGLYIAATGLMIGLGNYVQSVLKDRKDARKEKIDRAALHATAAQLAERTDATAQQITAKVDAVTEKVETVSRAVNGEGLGGKLDAVLRWQVEHDAQDNQRYDGLVAEILKLKGRAEGPPATEDRP
jgi:hypothetical protein